MPTKKKKIRRRPATAKKRTTRKKAAKRVAKKTGATKSKPKLKVKGKVIQFDKYLKNKKQLKHLQEQIWKEFKADNKEIVALKKLLVRARKAA